jgi:hypothetical protein
MATAASTATTPAERRAAIDRYLRAFETRRLPESTCADRLAELDREVRGLEARAAAPEAECDTTPDGHRPPPGRNPGQHRGRRREPPEQLKQLLDA